MSTRNNQESRNADHVFEKKAKFRIPHKDAESAVKLEIAVIVTRLMLINNNLIQC